MLPVVEIVVEIPMLVHDLVRLQSTVKPLNRFLAVGFLKKELMTPG
jgi:hypothetical protein